MTRERRAGVLLALYVLLMIVATPGLDVLGKNSMTTEAELRRVRERAPHPIVVPMAVAVADLNRLVRQPLVDLLAPLQRPFRIQQDWGLYRDGPDNFMLFEVWADDTCLHRSNDPEATWNKDVLRFRKVRPAVQKLTGSADARNAVGVTRWIVAEILKERPDVRKVEIRALHGPFPGTALTLHHSWVARAPTWKLVVTRHKKGGRDWEGGG